MSLGKVNKKYKLALFKFKQLSICAITCVFISCGINKYIPENELLYTGATVKIESAEKIDKTPLIDKITAVIKPAPNKKSFGTYPKLWRYMRAGENPKSKFLIWLKNKGEKPVYLSDTKPEATSQIIDATLFNQGIFNSKTTYIIKKTKHSAHITYISYVHKPFKIGNLFFNYVNDSITNKDSKIVQILNLIHSDSVNSMLKTGEPYNLDVLKQERIRIDELLKNNGYFYFNSDYLIFKADTSTEQNYISFNISVKENLPETAFTVYKIRKISINQAYSLKDDTALIVTDTLNFENMIFEGKQSKINIEPKVLSRSIYLKKGEIYSRQNHNITLNRLMSMGNFKFVQVKINDSDTSALGYLDVRVLMTPLPNHTIRAEADLVTKSNSYTGPKLNLSLLTRNTFGGAEQLSQHLSGSYELQLSGSNHLFAFSLNPQVELTIPRIMAPINIKPSKSIYVPKTQFTLSYNFLRRIGYYDMNTFQFIYGYKWRSNLKTEFEYNPVNVSFTSMNNESDVFLNLIENDPFLKKSYEEQFIPGCNFAYTYNEQMLAKKRTQYFINGTIETAGNLFWLAKTIVGDKPSINQPQKILGSVFSEYIKLSVDGRVNLNLLNKNKIVFRTFAGFAKPFGNSSLMPYSKQYFSGGPNSVRAFQINSLGPGIFKQSTDIESFLQLGGDIKVEMNAEYRFNIYKYFKGALFIDGGNVWLHKKNPSINGSAFELNKFLGEMAVGAGLGLRIDVSFFILRFDAATPIRKPWLPEGKRWVTSYLQPTTNAAWGSNNFTLNFAIGYPF